jgi:hypothetical protein
MPMVIPQSEEILEIWRECWKNFIVPPINGLYRDKTVLTRLSEAAMVVTHNFRTCT